MPAASSLTVWIAGAVFLAGGFAAGFVVGQGGDALDDDEPPPLERLDAPRPAASPVLTLDRPERSAEEEAHLESARAVELAPLRDLLDALPPIDAPRGSGVITGSVKTAEGAGVAGVEITLHPTQPDQGKQGYGWYDDADLTVAARMVIESLRWRRFARLQAVTGPDGTFRIDTVADLDHHTDARLEGWQIRPADPRRSYQARPGATLDFIAQAVVRVPVSIVMPDGSTPTTAMVMVALGGGTSGTGWSVQRPYAELQPGTWEVTAQAGDARQFKSEPQTVTLEVGVPASPLRFELQSHGGIRGKIEYAPGERYQQGRAYLTRIPKGQKADPAPLLSSEQTAHLHAWGGATPTFAFPDLVPGRYLVGFSRTYQGGIAVTQEVEVADEMVEVVLRVPPLRREEYISVSLVGPEGEPLAGAQLLVGRKSSSGSSSGGATVIEREDGTLWVMHRGGDSAASDADTTWWVEARHPQLGTRREEYRRTRASAVEIRYGKPGTLEVTVAGVVGTRYEGRIQVALSGAGSDRSGKLDDEGRVTLPGVQPGTYAVRLNLGGGRWQSQIHVEEVVIRSGENRIRIGLPALYEVEVVGLEGRAWVRSKGKGPRRLHRNLPAATEGRATLDGLPAGEYEVRSGSKRATFSLPGATSVRME